ncbi:hypothetical protein CA606_07305 [Caulobacter vibrioides]|uniref:Uncharacterized protein n=1 Tax=Caulobacter vibrioides TaxID=155892 RepID=A0A290MJC6_CAUVI|nr:hypothetical protein [Caulobacter vibrioides]ATC32175.1 hypothetical protein CA606_07305 [Caulobacter vibrioides]
MVACGNGANARGWDRDAVAEPTAFERLVTEALASRDDRSWSALKAYVDTLPKETLAAQADGLGYLSFLMATTDDEEKVEMASAAIALQAQAGGEPGFGVLIARVVVAGLRPSTDDDAGRAFRRLGAYQARSAERLPTIFLADIFLGYSRRVLLEDRADEALRTAHGAVALAEADPRVPRRIHIRALAALGMALNAQRRPIEAFEAFSEALRLGPLTSEDDVELRAGIATSLADDFNCEAWGRTAQGFKVRKAQDPNADLAQQAPYVFSLARAYKDCGDWQAAFDVLKDYRQQALPVLPAFSPNLGLIHALMAEITISDPPVAEAFLGTAKAIYSGARARASSGREIRLLQRMISRTQAQLALERGDLPGAARAHQAIAQTDVAAERYANYADWAEVLHRAKSSQALNAYRLSLAALPASTTNATLLRSRRDVLDRYLEETWSAARP